MGYELIVCEKPKAAEKIAYALADSRPIKKSEDGVPYYVIQHNGKEIVIGAAVGHIFGLAQKDKSSWDYPVFDIMWKPTYEVAKLSGFSKKYLNTLKKLAKDAEAFSIATDYDVEGEVIGLNILRFACKQKDGRRMKFSTLTKPDLVKAYESISPTLDWGQAKAGETRHILDWYYGINLSRALTLSMKKAGMFKVLSAGRVQGPALKIICDREKEIKVFVPTPYWELQLEGAVTAGKFLAMHETEKFWDKKAAETALANATGKPAAVEEVTRKQFSQSPPTPFDLTTLQTEAYRCFGIAPKDTLAIAQNLYTEGLISYPRTSSQKLPKEIGYETILREIQKQPDYKTECELLLKSVPLKPFEGDKVDPAHPAIYPTGIFPQNIEGRDKKIYDLVVRRFMAVFGKPAIRETMTAKVRVGTEPFLAKGTRTVEKNWHILYGKYATFKEEELPQMTKGDKVAVEKLGMEGKETQPPKRYTPSSIIKELEKRNLGTKSTRAAIIESLYDRNYAAEKSIEATELGLKTVAVLETYSPKILDEALTRKFEEQMELIRENKVQPEDVLEEARVVLYDILQEFKKNELEIGKALVHSFRDTKDMENAIGRCPSCKEGALRLSFSKKINKRFIACMRYPECKTIFQIPQSGRIKALHKECKQCNYPMIAISSGKNPQQICLNNNCPSKQQDASLEAKAEKISSGEITKNCPKCTKPLVLRRSIYGAFLGCTGYPNCRHTERLDGTVSKPKSSGQKKAKTKKSSSAKAVSQE